MPVTPSIVAIDACAWPVILRLSRGRLGIVYHNQPSHGFVEGDLAAVVSDDEGQTWMPAGIAAPHSPAGNRTHIASGVDHAGRWVVLSTGHRLAEGRMVGLQPPWFSRTSADGNIPFAWEISREVVVESPCGACIPHGRIHALPDGRLAATFYVSEGAGRPSHTWVGFSNADGVSWRDRRDFGNGDSNEACLLPRADAPWLAVARTHVDHHVRLHASPDAGHTWQDQGPLTLPMQHPADLIDLGDDGLLVTYGIRNRGLMGIGARISRDGGGRWSPPAVVYVFGDDTRDCGYPTTVACNDGSLLTAAYSDASPLHRGYHLLTVRWRLEDFFAPRPLRSISDSGPLRV